MTPSKPLSDGSGSRSQVGFQWRHAAAFTTLMILGFIATVADLRSPVSSILWLLGAGAAALASPPAALASILVGLPWVFHPLRLWGGQFSALEVGAVVGSLAIGARGLLSLFQRRQPSALIRLLSPGVTTWPAAALLIVGTASLVTVADPSHRTESLREFRTVIFEPLAVFALCRWCFVSPCARRWAAVTFMGTGAAVALVALGEVTLGANVLVADGAPRARVTYPHPNNLALYLERVSLFALGWAASAVPWGDRRGWVTGAAGVVTLAGTMATFSRGALLAVAVGLAVITTVVGSRRAWIALGGGLGLLVVFLLVLARSRLLATGAEGGESTRMLIWRSSLRMLQDHPVFGVGLDQFLYQYWRRYVEPAGWPERYTSHPHNLLLDVWLRLGILGVVTASWLAAAVTRLIRSLGLRRPYRGDLAVGSVAALSAGLAHGLVDNAFFLPDLAVMTWFFVALIEAEVADRP